MRARRPVARAMGVAAVAVAGMLTLAPQAVAVPVAPAQTTTAPSPAPTPAEPPPTPTQVTEPDPNPVPVPSTWTLAPDPEPVPQVDQVPRGGVDTGGGATIADRDRSGALLLVGVGLVGAAGALAAYRRPGRESGRG